jgi:hypothetical protein
MWLSLPSGCHHYQFISGRQRPVSHCSAEKTETITAVRLKREQIQLLFGGEAVGTVVAAPKGLLQGHLLEKRDGQDL